LLWKQPWAHLTVKNSALMFLALDAPERTM
jgi:hypothetical protein